MPAPPQLSEPAIVNAVVSHISFFYILLLQKYSRFYIYIAKVQLFIELSPSFIDKFDVCRYFLFFIELSDVNQ